MPEFCVSRTGVITYSRTWVELRNDCVGSTCGAVIVPALGRLCRLRFLMKSDRVDGRGLAWVNLRGSGLAGTSEYVTCVGSYQENGETMSDEAVDIETHPGGTLYINVSLDGDDPGSARAEVSLWWSDNPVRTRQNIRVASPTAVTSDYKYDKIQGEIKRMLRLMEKQVFKEEDKRRTEDVE